MGSNCLVTGAAGFIGSHLCEALLTRGHQVIGVDCFTTLYDQTQKRKNLNVVLKHGNAASFRFVEGDLLNLDLEKILESVELVFHLAGEPGVRQSWGNNFSTYVTRNILVTQRLLEHCKDKNLKKFVFASSSSVYGNRGNTSLSETDLCRPYSPYGVTKLSAENLCLLYADNFGIPTTALRYFTVFGPRQRPDMAFHRFFRNALEKKPIVVFGDGTQGRDFTYVSDAVEGNILAGEKGKMGEIYNIGGGCSATIEEVLKVVKDIVAPLPLQVNFQPRISGDVFFTQGNCSKAFSDLGFNPKIKLSEGLKKQWQWLREHLSL